MKKRKGMRTSIINKKSELPKYHMSKWGKKHSRADPHCEACCGRGYAVFERHGYGHESYAKYDGFLAVQKCDECDVIKYDEDAAKLANAAGIKCRLQYPCILKDQVQLVDLSKIPLFKMPTKLEQQAERFSSSRFNLEHAIFRALKKLPGPMREKFRTYRADHDSRTAFSNDGRWALIWQLRPHPELPIGPKVRQPSFGCVRLVRLTSFVVDAWKGTRLERVTEKKK